MLSEPALKASVTKVLAVARVLIDGSVYPGATWQPLGAVVASNRFALQMTSQSSRAVGVESSEVCAFPSSWNSPVSCTAIAGTMKMPSIARATNGMKALRPHRCHVERAFATIASPRASSPVSVLSRSLFGDAEELQKEKR